MQSFKRNFLLIIGLCLVVIFMGHSAWGEEKPLTLDEAMKLAMENNPALKVARERVVQAEADVDQAKSAMGPKLGSSVTYIRYDEEPRSSVIGGGGGYILKGFEDTWEGALTLTQVIYSGGSLRADRAAARLRTEAQRAGEIRTVQGVENQVSNAYYDLQRARANLGVAEESVRLAKEHLAEVGALFKHGVVARNEVLRVQVDVSDAELDKIRAENSVNVAWKTLSRAIGVSLPMSTALPSPAEDVDPIEMPEDPEKLALDQRPEMKALGLSRQAALQVAKSAAGQARPQISLQGKARDIGDDFYPDIDDDWTLTLSARWTLYDHGEVKAKVKKAKAMAGEFLGQVEDLEKQIVQEVATARLNLDSSLQRLDVARDQVDLAEEDYRMALQRYKVQAGTNLDVLDARVALIGARTQLVASVYDAYTAQADFLYAIGRSVENYEY